MSKITHKDLMFKWFHLSGAVLEFYDAVNKESTRNRKLYSKHLEKIIEAVWNDLVHQTGSKIQDILSGKSNKKEESK